MLSVILHALAIVLLTCLLGLFSYLYRLHQEKGRQASRRVREHLEHFHENVAPRLKMERRRAMQSFALLAQLTLVLVALAIGFAAETFAHSAPRAVFETAFFVVLEILIVYQFIPYVLLTRTSGQWLVPLVPVLRGFGYVVLPLQAVYELAVSLLHLTEEEEPAEAGQPEQALEELVEEGQERGIFEKEDVALIASVLHFADKTAREVMTPRPEIVGIEASSSAAQLKQLVRKQRFSRIPVFGRDRDDIKGVVFVRDLLEVPESEADRRLVGDLMRPVAFVPETKPVVDVVRELQAERHEIAVVVDEYGGVAGLITLEDLAEEVIGEISDADQVRKAEIVRENDNTYLVRGGIELERLRGTLGISLEGGPTTFAGLVHEWFGYVPKPGETVERKGMRVEVLEATARRVVRLRVTLLSQPSEVSPAARGRSRSAP